MNLKMALTGWSKAKLLGGIAGAAAVSFATLGVTHHAAFAQEPGAPTPAATATAVTSSSSTPKPAAKGARSSAGQSFLAQVAAQLHVTTEQLTTAITSAEKQAVQVRVASGTLTQTQADKLIAAIDKGGPALLPRILARHEAAGGHHRAKGGHAIGEHVIGVVAKQTGLTPKQVIEQLRAGSSLAQIAQSKGVAESQLAAAITADVKQRLDAQVAAGKVSADQESKLLEAATKHLDKLLEHQPKQVKK